MQVGKDMMTSTAAIGIRSCLEKYFTDGKKGKHE